MGALYHYSLVSFMDNRRYRVGIEGEKIPPKCAVYRQPDLNRYDPRISRF